jgi:hypothetical protein
MPSKSEFKELFKEIDGVFNSMDQTFKQLDQTFKTLEQIADERFQTAQQWQKHTLKFPKRVKGRWYWPGDTVYRKLNSSDGKWKYGDDFDAIRDSNGKS